MFMLMLVCIKGGMKARSPLSVCRIHDLPEIGHRCDECDACDRCNERDERECYRIG